MAVQTTSREADAALMSGFLGRRSEAAADLYDRYSSRIYGLGLVLLRNKTDAEDLVQDTFLRMLRSGSGFDPGRGSLDVWVLMIARNLALDLIRRRSLELKKLSAEPAPSEASDEPGPEWFAEHGDLMRRARAAMELLPSGQRSALELAYLGERSSTEVAELEGIPTGTVKSRIRAGMATLREALAAEASGTESLSMPEGVEFQACG